MLRLAILALALPSIAAAQTAILQIEIVEGEGTVHAPGVSQPPSLYHRGHG